VEADIYDRLGPIFRTVFGRDDIRLSPELSSRDVVGWDSFRHVEIILEIEARFGIRFKSRDMDEIRQLGDLVALIRRKLATAP